MKRLLTLFVLITTLLQGACSGSSTSLGNFTKKCYTPAFASGFEIRSAAQSSSTLIAITNPWQGAKGTEQQLLVLRDEEQAPEGFAGQVVEAPIRHAVCMSSSHVAMFDALEQMRRVSGVSGIDYITNEYIQEHRLCGEVRDVGYDTNINYELLASMRPDIVLLYGVTGENTVITGKLRELRIPYLYIGDHTEQSPLGKAEWLMVVAELCDLRAEGVARFEAIASRYNRLKESVTPKNPRPTVMLNTPYRDTWFMPGMHNYIVQLIEDAGGQCAYAAPDTDTSTPIDIEQAYLLANGADLWLNVGPCNTIRELTNQNPKFSAIPSVRNRRVFNNNRRQTIAGGSDFWESGVVRPDRILHDLIQIMEGNGTGMHYYKRLE